MKFWGQNHAHDHIWAYASTIILMRLSRNYLMPGCIVPWSTKLGYLDTWDGLKSFSNLRNHYERQNPTHYHIWSMRQSKYQIWYVFWTCIVYTYSKYLFIITNVNSEVFHSWRWYQWISSLLIQVWGQDYAFYHIWANESIIILERIDWAYCRRQFPIIH